MRYQPVSLHPSLHAHQP